MLDVLFINPPSPDGEVFIRDICRVGRRSREKMVWPQTALAQLAAMLYPKYTVAILDCIAEEFSWEDYKRYIKEKKPRYLVTHVTAPTLTNDMYGTFLAKALGIKTIAIGTHVTPLAKEVLENFPTLDYVIKGEPEITLKELVDSCERKEELNNIKGLAFRKNGVINSNEDRPLIEDLDSLPLPLHNLLPLDKYRIPMIKGKYAFVLTNRGCPYPCRFCIQKIMWKKTVRSRSVENVMKELRMLKNLGVNNIHFLADAFTLSKELVIPLCNSIIEEKLNIRWTCNSRVDIVNKELLELMKKAGCWMISWGLESGNQEILDRAEKKITVKQIEETINLSHKIGIGNWGYFILGLPGETKQTIEETIRFAKRLPLDLVLFHIAVPYIGTDFYEEAKEKGWLRVSDWEDFDMECSSPIEYPDLSAKEIEESAKRAIREWYLRPYPIFRLLKGVYNIQNLKGLGSIALSHLRWLKKK